MITADTSVVLPALAGWHERHAEALDAVVGVTDLIAHVELEAFAALTRLPERVRVAPPLAAAALAATFPGRRLALKGAWRGRVVRELAEAGIAGGAAYDGLIGMTAREHGLELWSADRRAERTYARLGVTVRWL